MRMEYDFLKEIFLGVIKWRKILDFIWTVWRNWNVI